MLFAHLVGHIDLTLAGYLQDVPAILALKRNRDLIFRNAGHYLAELGCEAVCGHPVERAAIQRAAGVFRVGLGQLGKRLALGNTVVEALGELCSFTFGTNFAGFDEDVAHLIFSHQLAFSAALLQQLEDMKARRRAHGLGNPANIQLANRIGKRAWQLRCLAPAQFATFQCGIASRTASGEGVKVSPVLQLLIEITGRLGDFLHFALAGTFGQRQHDHRQAEVGRGLIPAYLGVEEVAYFLIGDLNGVAHPALAHSIDDHLPANLLAGLVVADAIALQGSAELLQGNVVACGDLLHGLVQGGVVDTNTSPFSHLQLNAFQHQAVEYL